jgi:hypothetical protein
MSTMSGGCRDWNSTRSARILFLHLDLVISDPVIWLEIQAVADPRRQSFIYRSKLIHYSHWQLVARSPPSKLNQLFPHYQLPPTLPTRQRMSSISSSFSSSSSSSSSSPNIITTFPSSALAAARMRRHRRDAISRQAESEWESQAPPAQTPFSTGWSWTDHPVPPTTTPVPPPPGNELICPLASLPSPSSTSSSSSSFAFPHVDTSLPPDQADDDDGDVDTELQATLARFAFPSTTRKHRRSGESIDHHPTPPSAVAVGGGATRRCGTGPVKRAQCTHCEHA